MLTYTSRYAARHWSICCFSLIVPCMLSFSGIPGALNWHICCRILRDLLANIGRYVYLRLPDMSSLVMSTISKRKHKCSDIVAYYRNKSKTFWFSQCKIWTEADPFDLVPKFFFQGQIVSVLAQRFWDEAKQFVLVQKLSEAKWNVSILSKQKEIESKRSFVVQKLSFQLQIQTLLKNIGFQKLR